MNSKWIEAVNALSVDPTAEIRCPNCGESSLEVVDQYFAGEQTFVRHIRCPRCIGSAEVRKTYKTHPHVDEA